MKSKSTFFILLLMTFSFAVKANNLPIPVSANESITVTLFFPTEIKKVIQPAVNYKFEFEQNATMATLVARKGAASNLTVITKCGSIFSFLLEYNDEVANFTYVLSAEQAIGKMNNSGTVSISETNQPSNQGTIESSKAELPNNTITEAPIKTSLSSNTVNSDSAPDNFSKSTETKNERPIGQGSSLYETNTEDYYAIFCENNYDQRPRLNKPVLAGSDVTLQLNTIAGDKNELYFILEVNNTLKTDFKTKELNFYVRTGQNDTPLTMTPLYVFNSPKAVASKGKRNMVYVFKEFKLSPNQKMFVVMDEVGGTHKKVMLKINSRTINSAGN